jgi:hypothetical protein
MNRPYDPWQNVDVDGDCAETRLLIEAGADTSASHRGKTAPEIGEGNGNAKMLAVLGTALGEIGG